MNLADLNFGETADEGSVLTIVHPVSRTPLVSDDGVAVTIQLHGMDSDIYVKTANKGRDSNIEAMRRKAKFSSAEDDQKGAKLLAACTITWTGVVQGWLDGTHDNTPAPFTPENAVKLYNNRGVRWLREQVDDFVHDRANFSKAS